MTPWLSIVGVGAEGIGDLPAPARVLIDNAEIVIGGARHLAMLPDDHPAERQGWASPIGDTVAAMKRLAGRRVVVLATGDPMSYGIGVTLGRAFGPDAMTVLPAPGAFSLAAARLGWALHETDCLTLHGRPLAALNLFVRPGARLLILSEDGGTPAQIAATLRDRGYGKSVITVLENMGAQNESARIATADDWDETPAADLNTVAVACVGGDRALTHSRIGGLPDDAFAHDGQLTKRVVRAATLSALAPQPGEFLWDVGAGCGSIAIEWMRAGGRAAAIERSPERCTLIARNAAMLGTPTLDIVTGTAPDALADLAQPDAIFIGGGVSALSLAEACWAALARGGRLVANAVTLEGEAMLMSRQEKWGGALTRIAVSEAKPIGGLRGWQPMRPVTQFSAVKP
ncbi:MAG: precorrin-6y C5,15-methyltransferase (decarboxylating) subunit CbiE [Alphaproteobacteria bacterium]